MNSSIVHYIKSLIHRIERIIMGRKAYKWVLRDWITLSDLHNARTMLETMRFNRQIEPQILNSPKGKKILVIAPHPDDELIGPGGTLIKSIEAGSKIEIVFVTTGKESEKLQRKKEAENICKKLGANFHFLDQEIYSISIDKTSKLFKKFFIKYNPDILFIPFLLDDNDDHRRVNQCLLNTFNNINKKPEIWAYQVYTPLPGNVAINITSIALKKSELIKQYKSQMLKRNWAHFSLGLNAFNCRLIREAKNENYFECFFVLPLNEYLELCRIYFSGNSTYYEKNYK